MKTKHYFKYGFLILSLGLFPSSLFSKEIQGQCATLSACADVVSKLTSHKYIYSSELAKSSIKSSGNLEITKENAEILFTKMLETADLARVKTNIENTYEIVRIKNVAQEALEKINCDAKNLPQLPNTWDHFTMSYKFSRKDMAKNAPRVLQDYLPRTSHILTFPGTENVYVTGSAPTLKRMYAILQELDTTGNLTAKKQ